MVLKKGHDGQEVSRLQTIVGGLTVDGDFGVKTEVAVISYQMNHNLVQDGIAGQKTLASLGMDVYPGIDVSHHNGKIDWDSVDHEKVAYVWTKISEGRTFKDKRRKENLEGCRRNGIPVGGYHFGRPENNDPVVEVHHFLKTYGGLILPGDLSPVLDLEAGVKTDDQHNVDWSLAWLQECEKETGRTPLLYTGGWAVSLYLKKASKSSLKELAKYPLWWARYRTPVTGTAVDPGSSSKMLPWTDWTVWQWTSKGDIDGVGRCDRNWLPGGPSALNSLLK